MPRDNIGILRCGPTDLKGVLHESKVQCSTRFRKTTARQAFNVQVSTKTRLSRTRGRSWLRFKLSQWRAGETVATSVGTDTIREMEAADWPSRSEERRVGKGWGRALSRE